MRPSLEQIRSQRDPMLTNRWALFFPKIPLQGSAFALPTDFNILCESITPPTMETSIVTTKIRQFTVNSPGISRPSGPITLTFFETLSMKITNFFLAWERSCSNPISGKLGNKKAKITDGSSLKNIEAIMTLFLLDNDNKGSFMYTMFGCIPKSFTPGELSSETVLSKPKVTISYDYYVTNEVGLSAVTDIISSVTELVTSLDDPKDFINNFGV